MVADADTCLKRGGDLYDPQLLHGAQVEARGKQILNAVESAAEKDQAPLKKAVKMKRKKMMDNGYITKKKYQRLVALFKKHNNAAREGGPNLNRFKQKVQAAEKAAEALGAGVSLQAKDPAKLTQDLLFRLWQPKGKVDHLAFDYTKCGGPQTNNGIGGKYGNRDMQSHYCARTCIGKRGKGGIRSFTHINYISSSAARGVKGPRPLQPVYDAKYTSKFNFDSPQCKGHCPAPIQIAMATKGSQPWLGAKQMVTDIAGKAAGEQLERMAVEYGLCMTAVMVA